MPGSGPVFERARHRKRGAGLFFPMSRSQRGYLIAGGVFALMNFSKRV